MTATRAWTMSLLCLLAGLSAVAGGAALVAKPDGSLIGLPLSVLALTPFHDFLIPGLLLAGAVGAPNCAAAFLYVRGEAGAPFAAFVGGGALVVWTAVEMLMLRTANALQLSCLAVGLAIAAGSFVTLLRPTGRPLTH